MQGARLPTKFKIKPYNRRRVLCTMPIRVLYVALYSPLFVVGAGPLCCDWVWYKNFFGSGPNEDDLMHLTGELRRGNITPEQFRELTGCGV